MKIKDREKELHEVELARDGYKGAINFWKNEDCICERIMFCERCQSIIFFESDIEEANFQISCHKEKIDNHYKRKAIYEIKKINSVMPKNIPPNKNKNNKI